MFSEKDKKFGPPNLVSAMPDGESSNGGQRQMGDQKVMIGERKWLRHGKTG